MLKANKKQSKAITTVKIKKRKVKIVKKKVKIVKKKVKTVKNIQ